MFTLRICERAALGELAANVAANLYQDEGKRVYGVGHNWFGTEAVFVAICDGGYKARVIKTAVENEGMNFLSNDEARALIVDCVGLAAIEPCFTFVKCTPKRLIARQEALAAAWVSRDLANEQYKFERDIVDSGLDRGFDPVATRARAAAHVVDAMRAAAVAARNAIDVTLYASLPTTNSDGVNSLLAAAAEAAAAA